MASDAVIIKGKLFNPDASARQFLEQAAKVGYKMGAAISSVSASVWLQRGRYGGTRGQGRPTGVGFESRPLVVND
jgi:hypothetical protein